MRMKNKDVRLFADIFTRTWFLHATQSRKIANNKVPYTYRKSWNASKNVATRAPPIRIFYLFVHIILNTNSGAKYFIGSIYQLFQPIVHMISTKIYYSNIWINALPIY